MPQREEEENINKKDIRKVIKQLLGGHVYSALDVPSFKLIIKPAIHDNELLYSVIIFTIEDRHQRLRFNPIEISGRIRNGGEDARRTLLFMVSINT